VALALAVAFVPRRRDIVTIAALGAAVIIALQLGVTYWFYLYIVWFFPLVVVALFGSYPAGDEPHAAAERGRAEVAVPAVLDTRDVVAVQRAQRRV
jgi:hypothetical protein